LENEKSSIQRRIDALTAELEKNGGCAESLLSDLPLVIYNIEGGPHLELLRSQVKDLYAMWSKHPQVQTYWRYQLALLERDMTRRAISENIEVGWCERIGEL
jgi:hypothetical protein